jgi:hypothetical protein
MPVMKSSGEYTPAYVSTHTATYITNHNTKPRIRIRQVDPGQPVYSENLAVPKGPENTSFIIFNNTSLTTFIGLGLPKG